MSYKYANMALYIFTFVLLMCFFLQHFNLHTYMLIEFLICLCMLSVANRCGVEILVQVLLRGCDTVALQCFYSSP